MDSIYNLAFSDWRVQDIDDIVDYVSALKRNPDIIVYAVDDIRRFNLPSLETVKMLLKEKADVEMTPMGG